MKKESESGKKRGVRYDAKARQEVVVFAQAHDTEHGRGGATAAAEKFGVTLPTVARWVREESGGYQAGGGGRAEVLEQMAVIARKIAELEAEFGRQKRKL